MKTDKIRSVDVITEEIKTLSLEKTVFIHNTKRVELHYFNCLSPMNISEDEYKKMLNGETIELHKGEVFIRFLSSN